MLNLLILAAGMGSRYGGIKQIEAIGPNGEIIIDYSIYDAKKAGINKFVFVIRKDLETDFKNLLDSKYHGTLNYEFAFQDLDYCIKDKSLCANRKKPWGTGHAILCAKEALNSNPFIVINADDYYGPSAYKTLSNYMRSQKDDTFSMVAYLLGTTLSKFGTVSRGVCELNKDDTLKSITELKKIKKTDDKIFDLINSNYKLYEDSPVSMNFWGFNKTIFKFLEKTFNDFLSKTKNLEDFEFFIPLFINHYIKENIVKTKVLKTSDTWFGITYKEDKAQVLSDISKLIENGTYPERIY